MEKRQEASRPLPLTGARNVRDLGVYQNRRGRKLRERRLLRADGPQYLTDEDLAYLRDYGLIGSVDLRSDWECKHAPSRLRELPGAFYEQVSLQDGIQSNGLAGGFPASLGALYVDLLRCSGEKLAQVWRLLGRCRDGCVLFHCSAGKDRTGVVAMLALAAAGVDRETILTDYEVSEPNMRETFARQKRAAEAAGLSMPDHLFGSDRREMEQALDYLEERFGTAEAYLRSIGLTAEEISAVTEGLGAEGAWEEAQGSAGAERFSEEAKVQGPAGAERFSGAARRAETLQGTEREEASA